jgi:hypothetical protein
MGYGSWPHKAGAIRRIVAERDHVKGDAIEREPMLRAWKET